MLDHLNVVLAGVGGQGTLVAGKILGSLALQLGLDVKVSEVHGMSQRGGSVITYARIGREVFSPVIEPGTADVLLAFEELEALRWAHLLRQDGILLINTWRIAPLPVAMGQAQYPVDIAAALQAQATGRTRVRTLDARSVAASAGSEKAVNLVMLGAMARLTGLPESLFQQAIAEVFPARLRSLNQQAFAAGSAIMETNNP
jgi:indolepyruvate ferredoxin oxidoreductase beta subunit